MAFTTKQQRLGAFLLGMVFRTQMFEPDGTIDVGDRVFALKWTNTQTPGEAEAAVVYVSRSRVGLGPGL